MRRAKPRGKDLGQTILPSFTYLSFFSSILLVLFYLFFSFPLYLLPILRTLRSPTTYFLPFVSRCFLRLATLSIYHSFTLHFTLLLLFSNNHLALRFFPLLSIKFPSLRHVLFVFFLFSFPNLLPIFTFFLSFSFQFTFTSILSRSLFFFFYVTFVSLLLYSLFCPRCFSFCSLSRPFPWSG